MDGAELLRRITVELQYRESGHAASIAQAEKLHTELSRVKRDMDELARPAAGAAIARDLDAAVGKARELETQLQRAKAVGMAPISVVSGQTAPTDRFMRDTHWAMRNGVGTAGDTRYMASWMPAELDRMRAARAPAPPRALGEFDLDRGRAEQVRAERARRIEAMRVETERLAKAQENAAKSSSWVDALSKSTQPLSRVSELMGRATFGLGLFSLAGAGVVAAVGAISDAFDESGKIARRYEEATKNLREELERLRNFNRETDVLLGGKPQTSTQKRIEEIQGSAFAPGEWEKWKETRDKIQERIEDLQMTFRSARIRGVLGVDGSGQAQVDRAALDSYNSPGTARNVRERAAELAKALGELAALDAQNPLGPRGDAAINLRIKDQVDSATQAFIDTIRDKLPAIAAALERARQAFAVHGMFNDESLSNARIFGWTAGGAQWAEERDRRRLEFAKSMDLSGFFTPKKVTADFRGSKFQITQRVETNNPAMLARQSLRAGYEAVARYPIESTPRPGSVKLANGR